MSAAPLRLLIVLPSWVGDATMATPVLGMIRAALPGSFIGALARPGIDQLLAGTSFFDEIHVARGSGVMGPKHVAAKIRPRRYDTALLLTGSFSTALTVRVAGIPRRIGYDRDARGLLLTDKITPPRDSRGWRVIPAVDYYFTLVRRFLPLERLGAMPTDHLPPGSFLHLVATDTERAEADEVLRRAGVTSQRLAILNPGGNKPEKRWPGERFAAIADHLAERHGCTVLLNGSPAEAELLDEIAGKCRHAPAPLARHGVTLGSLKAIVARCSLMVTNDTGPRHIAAAFGVPLVSLFGPTDPRWTTIPTRPGAPEAIVVADPTLPESEFSNDHPERCAITKIAIDRVVSAVDSVLAAPPLTRGEPAGAAQQ
jgi:heptosyltransferase-2